MVVALVALRELTEKRFSHHSKRSNVIGGSVNMRRGQVQHRLRDDEIDDLVAAYEGGCTVDELAEDFQVHRTTVMSNLKRRGVKTRRNHGLTPEQIEIAAELYREGWSLARVGERFHVDARTVRDTLAKFGVEIRPRRGW
jgi:DNA-directed RNA polymerase specialized sigma24 family protein